MTKFANLVFACLALCVSQRPKSLFIVPAQIENDIEMSFTNKTKEGSQAAPDDNREQERGWKLSVPTCGRHRSVRLLILVDLFAMHQEESPMVPRRRNFLDQAWA